MIRFEEVIESLKKLDGLSILHIDDISGRVFFSKEDTKFILNKPQIISEFFPTDFTVMIAINFPEYKEGKLTYNEMLEIANKLNQNPNTSCKIFFNKEIGAFFAEVNHILYGQEFNTNKISNKHELDDYLSLALLSIMMMLIKSSEDISLEVNNSIIRLSRGFKK